MAARTLLDDLRSKTTVDCDTLDYNVAKTLGPFVDCTSNQAIVLAELQTPSSSDVVSAAVSTAQKLHPQYPEITLVELAVEIMAIMLSTRMTSHITGYAHIQTNPLYAFSTSQTIANAHRIIALYNHIRPSFPPSRICIKIPSTWEGLLACRALEADGVATLATTLFSMPQAALAASVGCTYIAPYVNSLRTHFEPGFVDAEKGFGLCWEAQKYFETKAHRTKVLAASLVSVDEVMALKGLSHITVSAPLLAELAATAAGPGGMERSNGLEDGGIVDLSAVVADEAAYRIAFTLDKGGASEKKLTEAINIFATAQKSLEALARAAL